MNHPSWRKIINLLAVALGAGGGVAAAAEPVVQMSPFEVSANSVDFRSWIKVGSPNYIIYTDGTEKEARSALRELEELRVVAQVFFRRTAWHLPPTIIVLPTSHSDWHKIENKGNVEWRVAVSTPGEGIHPVVLVEYDWQSEGLGVVRTALGRSVTESLGLKGPFWFESGVGTFFETLEISKDQVTLGRQNPRVLALARNNWIDWPKFFQLTGQSVEFKREGTVQQVNGQAALFVHFMLTHAEPAWMEKLLDWSARLEAGRDPTEEEFKRVFGQDWKAWSRTMGDYFDTGRYRLRNFSIGQKNFEFATTKFDLPVREMRELFVLAQILNQNVPASDAALDSVLAHGLQTESLRELLALACFARDRKEAGGEQLRLLVDRHTGDPQIHALLAAKVLFDQVPKLTSGARLSAEAAAEARALCDQALALEPNLVNAINVLVWLEALGPAVGPQSLAAIERRYQQLDGYASTSDAVAAMGVAAWRTGETAWARRIALALAESPYADKDGRQIAGELLKELGAEPAAAAPPIKPD